MIRLAAICLTAVMISSCAGEEPRDFDAAVGDMALHLLDCENPELHSLQFAAEWGIGDESAVVAFLRRASSKTLSSGIELLERREALEDVFREYAQTSEGDLTDEDWQEISRLVDQRMEENNTR